MKTKEHFIYCTISKESKLIFFFMQKGTYNYAASLICPYLVNGCRCKKQKKALKVSNNVYKTCYIAQSLAKPIVPFWSRGEVI